MKVWAPSTVPQTVTNVSAAIVPMSVGRKVLVLTCAAGGDIWLAWTPGVVANGGVLMKANGPPIILTEEEHGALCYGPVFGVASIASLPWSFTECVGPAS